MLMYPHIYIYGAYVSLGILRSETMRIGKRNNADPWWAMVGEGTALVLTDSTDSVLSRSLRRLLGVYVERTRCQTRTLKLSIISETYKNLAIYETQFGRITLYARAETCKLRKRRTCSKFSTTNTLPHKPVIITLNMFIKK